MSRFNEPKGINDDWTTKCCNAEIESKNMIVGGDKHWAAHGARHTCSKCGKLLWEDNYQIT